MAVEAGTTSSVADARAGAGAEVRRAGLAASLLPGIAYAVFSAAGVVAVVAFVQTFSASYLAWRIILTALVFWCAAAAVGAVALAIGLLPVLLFIKGRARPVIMPGVIVATGCAAVFFALRGDLAAREPLAAGLLLHPAFLAAMAAVMGIAAATLAAKDAARRWPAVILFIAAPLLAGGASFFAPKDTAALMLVAGGLLVAAICAAVMERIRRKRLFAVCATAAFAGMLLATGYAAGTAPLEPIDQRGQDDPAKAAMLAGKPNVIIVVLDTVRADHTSLCGYKYATTPSLELLAKDAWLFPYGESVDSWTLPAHASLFTGLYPREHGAHASSAKSVRNIDGSEPYGIPLAPSRKTLAWFLSQAGYRTGGIAANYSWLCRQFGLDQGFDYYYDLPRMLLFQPGSAPVFKYPLEKIDAARGMNGKLLQTYWDAESITAMAESWLEDAAGAPFFLFLNYMDAHYPYSAVPPFDMVQGARAPYDHMLRQRPFQELINRYIRTGDGLDAGLQRSAVSQYDGAIAYTDHWVGKLVEHLKAKGLYDDTLLIVTSDHGEYFGEHRLLNHGVGIYEEGVRVPILVKYPDRRHAGEVSSERVSIIDVFATVLDTLGFKAPDVTARPLGGADKHEVLAESFENGLHVRYYGSMCKGDKTAIYDGRWKYIRADAGEDELYDLESDAGEQADRRAAVPDVASELDSRIVRWQEAVPLFDGAAESSRSMSPAEIERLRSLGYLNR